MKPVINQKLENGSTIIAIRETMSEDEVVILVVSNNNQYVTWRCFNNNSDTYAGHYFIDLLDAYADFIKR